MVMPTVIRNARWDAPFWGGLLLVFVSLGSFGCFGMAAITQASPRPRVEILDTDNCPPPADL